MGFKSHIWLSKPTYGFYQIYLINGSLTGFENEKFGFQNPNLVFKNQIWFLKIPFENRIYNSKTVFRKPYLCFKTHIWFLLKIRIWFLKTEFGFMLKTTFVFWNTHVRCEIQIWFVCKSQIRLSKPDFFLKTHVCLNV